MLTNTDALFALCDRSQSKVTRNNERLLENSLNSRSRAGLSYCIFSDFASFRLKLQIFERITLRLQHFQT